MEGIYVPGLEASVGKSMEMGSEVKLASIYTSEQCYMIMH